MLQEEEAGISLLQGPPAEQQSPPQGANPPYRWEVSGASPLIAPATATNRRKGKPGDHAHKTGLTRHLAKTTPQVKQGAKLKCNSQAKREGPQ